MLRLTPLCEARMHRVGTGASAWIVAWIRPNDLWGAVGKPLGVTAMQSTRTGYVINRSWPTGIDRECMRPPLAPIGDEAQAD